MNVGTYYAVAQRSGFDVAKEQKIFLKTSMSKEYFPRTFLEMATKKHQHQGIGNQLSQQQERYITCNKSHRDYCTLRSIRNNLEGIKSDIETLYSQRDKISTKEKPCILL